MSAIAPLPGADGLRRPRVLRLIGAVLGAEFLGAVLLWLAVVVLGLIGLIPGDAGRWLWLPWRIDGLWALVGAAGWGYLVCVLLGALMAGPIERRGYGRPHAGWLRLAVAISGYGAMAAARTSGGRVFYAVVAGAVLIRLMAFRHDGSLRPWRLVLPRRAQIAVALTAALLAGSFGITHPFGDSGGGVGSALLRLRVGRSVSLYEALTSSRLPVEITGAAFTGPGVRFSTSQSITVSADNGRAARLPYHLAAGQQLWVNSSVRLTVCAEGIRADTLKLRYTVLGIATAESIALQSPVRLGCRR